MNLQVGLQDVVGIRIESLRCDRIVVPKLLGLVTFPLGISETSWQIGNHGFKETA